ncbi:MAG: hypothetical protein ACYS99_18670 [Planctomycetota bacterium]|jgi:hypothetical protein
MRISVPGLTLIALVLPGCFLCPQPRAVLVPARRETPEAAYELFRAALVHDRPDILYESLSPGFKQRYGLPGPREFNLVYERHRSDLADLAFLLERAEVKGIRRFERWGRRFAVVTVGALGREAEFLLADTPSWEALLEIPEYGPETTMGYLPGKDFSAAMEVTDGMIRVSPLDARKTGIDSASQVLRLSFEHHWLLEDLPADARSAVEKLGSEEPDS